MSLTKRFAITTGAALIAAMAAFTTVDARPGDPDGEGPGCGCNNGGTNTGNGGNNNSRDNLDLCVVAPQVLYNDGATVVFRGHIERWEDGRNNSGNEIDVYNQFVQVSAQNFQTMMSRSASVRASGLFGFGGNDERVFRLGTGDDNIADPAFIEQACTRQFGRLLGRYGATLTTQPAPAALNP